MRRLAAITLVGLMASPSASVACSCISANLEQHYTRSSNVLTAVITEIEFVPCPDYPDGFECTKFEAKFEATRIFKGNVPFETIKSHVGGASCGSTFTVGMEYLFFIGNEGQTGMCSGTMIVSGTNETAAQAISILEDYSSGLAADLSTPWASRNYNGVCTLSADFLVAVDRGRTYMGWIEVNARNAERQQNEYESDELDEMGFAAVRVYLPMASAPDNSSVSIAIGEHSFPLEWREYANRSGGRFGLHGDLAAHFIELLAEPGAMAVYGSIPSVKNLNAQIRRTRAAPAIDEFIECVSKAD